MCSMNVNGLSATNGVTTSSENMADIQLEFAKLQMQLADYNKGQAMEKITRIKANQNKVNNLVNLIASLRSSLGTKDDDKVSISQSLGDTAKEFGVNIHTGNVTNAQLKADIESLQAKQDTFNADVQQEMVLIQDFMGKYSAYTSGATSQISKFADTLTNVARGQ